MEDKLSPRYLSHFAGEGEILVPSMIMCNEQFVVVRAAGAIACLNKCIMVDILISKFSKAVASGLVLDNSPKV